MCIVHAGDVDKPAIFGCAQTGCRACLEALVERHEGLVHAVLRRQLSGPPRYCKRGGLGWGRRCCISILGAEWPSPAMPGWLSSAGYGKQWRKPSVRKAGWSLKSR